MPDFCPKMFIFRLSLYTAVPVPGLAWCTVMTVLGLACCTVMTVPGLACCTVVTCFRQNLPVTASLWFLYSQKIKIILSVCVALIIINDNSCYIIVNFSSELELVLQASFTCNKYCCTEAKPEASTAVQEPSLEIRPHLESNQTRFKTISTSQNAPCDQRILKPVTKIVTQRRNKPR